MGATLKKFTIKFYLKHTTMHVLLVFFLFCGRLVRLKKTRPRCRLADNAKLKLAASSRTTGDRCS